VFNLEKQSKHPHNHGLYLKNEGVRRLALTFTHYLKTSGQPSFKNHINLEMKQFFTFVFASCLGLFLAFFLVIFFTIGIAGLSGSGDENSAKKAEANSVLDIKLESGMIPELTDNVEKSPFSNDKVMSVHALVNAIDHAATDDDIKGIALTSRQSVAGFTQAQQLREAVERFKKSGKFVVAYADDYSQGAYYLASVADSIMLNPNGDIDFKGFAAQVPFMKDLLDRLDVKWQVYYAGQFKSATETFRLNKMSDQNRLQLHAYLDGLYNLYLDDVSKSRKVSKAELYDIADKLKVHNARDAVRLRLVDCQGYYDEFQKMLRNKLNIKDKDKINSIQLMDYAQGVERDMGSGKDKIAVVYAEGTINYGNAEDEKSGEIEGLRYAKIIRKLRQDDKVKAIVLRINSGGGSVVGSDILLRELQLAKQAGKVIVSSFGEYAASGGYYIAMASDSIFAEPATLTGSIGVFSMIPSFQKTFKNKMGISFDTVKTAGQSQGLTTNFDVNDYQAKILQAGTDSIYEQFLKLVANNRHKTRDEIHAIAQGRIWIAAQGKENGLVDKIGGLDAAIASAASKAGLTTYKMSEYPKPKNALQSFIEQMTGKHPKSDGIKAALIREELGEYAEFYDYAKQIKTWKGPQMRLPFVMKVQ
jgi:protease IV